MTRRWMLGCALALSIGLTGCGQAPPVTATPPAPAVVAPLEVRPTYHTQGLLDDVIGVVKKAAKTVISAPKAVSKAIDKGSGALGKVVGSAVGVVAGKKAGRAVGNLIGKTVGSVVGNVVGVTAINKVIKTAKALKHGRMAGAARAIGGDSTMAAAQATQAILDNKPEAAVDALSGISPDVAKAIQAAKVAQVLSDKDTASALAGGNMDPELSKLIATAKQAQTMASTGQQATDPDVAQAAAAAKAADLVQQGGMETSSNEVDAKSLAAAKVAKALAGGDMAGALTAASTLDPKVAMALLTALAAQEQLTGGTTAVSGSQSEPQPDQQQ